MVDYVILFIDKSMEYLQSINENIPWKHLLGVNEFVIDHLLSIILSLVVIIITGSFVFQPSEESIYKNNLQHCWKDMISLMKNSHANPSILRLAWSDAVNYDRTLNAYWPYCGGCNGSIRFDSELKLPAHIGLDKSISLLTPLKKKYDVISWADLIQMAGVAAVYTSGGPYIDIKYGRIDIPVDLNEIDSYQEEIFRKEWKIKHLIPITKEDYKSRSLPQPLPPYPNYELNAETHLRNLFDRLGLLPQEGVALCGAHTIGRAHKDQSGVCSYFSGDLGATKYTSSTALPKGDGETAVKLPGGCSWTINWMQFDNAYFRRPLDRPTDQELLWLPIDAALLDSPEYREYFLLYGENQQAFFDAFTKAYQKMSELGSKFQQIVYLSNPTLIK